MKSSPASSTVKRPMEPTIGSPVRHWFRGAGTLLSLVGRRIAKVEFFDGAGLCYRRHLKPCGVETRKGFWPGDRIINERDKLSGTVQKSHRLRPNRIKVQVDGRNKAEVWAAFLWKKVPSDGRSPKSVDAASVSSSKSASPTSASPATEK